MSICLFGFIAVISFKHYGIVCRDKSCTQQESADNIGYPVNTRKNPAYYRKGNKCD